MQMTGVKARSGAAPGNISIGSSGPSSATAPLPPDVESRRVWLAGLSQMARRGALRHGASCSKIWARAVAPKASANGPIRSVICAASEAESQGGRCTSLSHAPSRSPPTMRLMTAHHMGSVAVSESGNALPRRVESTRKQPSC